MALYHTYRPQSFESIAGQQHIKQTIQNQIKTNKLAHAYLFSGPRGVGKTTTARLIAKAANCEKRKDGEAEPCNKCTSCEEISKGIAIDIFEIDAASHTGVDNVRENIIDNVQFGPSRAKKKVFIIDEVHMLSTSAFNALLKTLEEPPKHAIFVLATTELHKLPETIVSRCQHFTFSKLPFATMKMHLEKIAKAEKVILEEEVYERIIAKSDGCARDGVKLLDQLLATGEKKIDSKLADTVLPRGTSSALLDFFDALFALSMQDVFNECQNLNESNIHVPIFINDLLEKLRELMYISFTQGEEAKKKILVKYDENTQKRMLELSSKTEAKDFLRFIDILLARKKQVKFALK